MNNQDYEGRKKLLRLMQENPELPVVPVVDNDIITDESCGYWLGRLQTVEIRGYIVTNDQLHLRDEDDLEEVFDTLSDYCRIDAYKSDITDEQALKMYASLPWIKAIVVYIGLYF